MVDIEWEGLLSWAVIFLVIALIAGFFGFGFISGTSFELAKVLFYVFIVLFIVTLVMRFVRDRW